ncbi:Succinyl-CoA:(R)-benzylsuccinate CoA-transferase subunit BbsF [Thalassovita gelatinovora]|uniref:Succinyl-CoA:(R)-benzylsuccinate CoA-transferase subunit BbsF n=1 Tax=Thalassovita gelatinovora TaxID=53501 RepID=A0A0P1FI30_THAGE|nr:CaiB/BaiF CoA-transferase family protein [Thalassovita gelatinovora]QIZ82061.1 CoA transferase [Thalassovita gelatinovora]CUH67569.1 Succinyl-CoA:(R)-benzylsuccinate CoA-transferase subunit BbsF [Thalassovita gelatinovora]SEP71584.1 alpha-methylacyl-CoA racemase [Thalassovita gelatinovora]
MSGPLSGLKVVEMQGLGPAPLAGQFLSDLGAEVTLIARKSGRADPTDINNRGKRSVALNLKDPDGVEAALRLIDRADVVIEGFRPGVMERIGLGPETCQARNPALIFARMTGWGQDGPLAQTAGHDINYLGLTGVLHAIGKKDEPPIPPLNIGADYAGGTMFLLLGILSALFERQASGRGQVVDAAMVDAAPALLALIHSMIAQGRWSEDRESNWLDGGAPFYRTYECADGKYVSVGALEPQFFAQLVDLAGLPQDEKQNQYDETSWAQRRESYAKVFATKTRAEWTEIFDGSDACIGPVLSWSEAPEHPHMKARGVFTDVNGVTQVTPAPRFDRTPPGPVGQPPTPGGDTDSVLAELGYDADMIASLRNRGVLS